MGSYADYTELRVTLQDYVLRVVMDNPPLNANTAGMHRELSTIFSAAHTDPDVRVIILTGGGERAFSAGGDLQSMVTRYGDRDRWMASMEEAEKIIVSMLECDKPIISRINGHAMGLGASLALAGDITIMVEDSKIGDPHVNIGLTAGDGGALLWPHIVGLMPARKHLLSGEPLTGAEAAAIGLVTTSTSRENLDAEVSAWVSRLLQKSPVAVQTTKRALNMGVLQAAKQFSREHLKLETQSWDSPNHLEAVKAILEKRAPVFE